MDGFSGVIRMSDDIIVWRILKLMICMAVVGFLLMSIITGSATRSNGDDFDNLNVEMKEGITETLESKGVNIIHITIISILFLLIWPGYIIGWLVPLTVDTWLFILTGFFFYIMFNLYDAVKDLWKEIKKDEIEKYKKRKNGIN